MGLFIIIQARMTSTRLPKKVALPLANKKVLEVLLTRLAKYKDNIIIATTNTGDEAPIVDMANNMGVKYYRGDEANVLQRYYLSAIEYGAKSGDTIVRITSDCPLYSTDILDKCIEKYNNTNTDYLYADIHHSFPRGFDTEVFSFDLLQEAYQNATKEFEKEHVTPYIKTKENIKISSYNDNENNAHYRLTLDTKEDLEVITKIYEILDNRLDITYQEIITTLKQNPQIAKINENVEQKSYTN